MNITFFQFILKLNFDFIFYISFFYYFAQLIFTMFFYSLLGYSGLTAMLHLFLQIDDPILFALRMGLLAFLFIYGYIKKSLTHWIFISMIVGLIVGIDFKSLALELNVLSKVFLKLIKTAIAPLLFATLVVGIAGHSDSKQVGRLGWKSMTYFISATTMALLIGLIAINISGAGKGIAKQEEKKEKIAQVTDLQMKINEKDKTYQWIDGENIVTEGKPKPKQSTEEVILHTFPENVAKMIYEGQVLQVVVFSILFALGLMMVQEPHKSTMLHFSESLAEVMFKFTGIIMYMAPLAVGAALAYTIAKMGLGVLTNLAMLLATLYVALLAFLAFVLLPLMLILRIPVKKFIQAVTEPATLAFATASSEAALPKAMRAMEEFGVPRKIVSFVIPTGYSFNLDGTTLYLSLATIFVAQAAGKDLPITTQLAMMASLLLMSKGVAGVPRASLVILSGAATMYDLPEWPIAVILGIDAIMDMARTAVNLIGNCLASVVVAIWEGEFNVQNNQHTDSH